jgi:hypothetical protein
MLLCSARRHACVLCATWWVTHRDMMFMGRRAGWGLSCRVCLYACVLALLFARSPMLVRWYVRGMRHGCENGEVLAVVSCAHCQHADGVQYASSACIRVGFSTAVTWVLMHVSVDSLFAVAVFSRRVTCRTCMASL